MRFYTLGDSLRVVTPAKINLALQVLGRREDGYHNLRTLMVSVALHDTLTICPADNGHFSLRFAGAMAGESSIPMDQRNLVWKAAELLKQASGCPRGAQIALQKRIPSEAGLGGGSSDAAATLCGLNRFWNLQLPSPRLHELAATLGSDVNFFLDSLPAAVCTGRGEHVAAAMLPRPLPVVLIKPPVGLSTGRVFQQWAAETERCTAEIPGEVSQLQLSSPRQIAAACGNDLEMAARELSREVDDLLTRLQQLDVVATGMTGSGSVCFAVCRTARQARVVAARMRSGHWGQVLVATTGV